jgi:penicillin-binding protein 2
VTTTGTAALAHLPGIDFAGKTGTAQTISLEARKRMGSAGKKFEDNAWFVGMTPRRNPEIVVAVLSQGAGWGWRSGIVASKIIKVYVDKKQARLAGKPYTVPNIQPVTPGAKGGAGESAPDSKPAPGAPPVAAARLPTQMGGVWSDGGERLHAHSFALPASGAFHRAVAAPGMERFAENAGGLESGRPQPKKRTGWRELPGVAAALPEPRWRTGVGN